ncbi:hypothetical protein EV126DRAFT_226866 [Verticillium dahliae]|nr:hypothetical protein EV126DRAFT_226866 [Verticillium dahliae]
MAANVARHDEIGPGLVLYTCLLSTACPRSTPNSLFSSPLRVGVTMQIRPPPRTAPRIPSLSAPWRPRERNRRTSILARPAGGGGGHLTRGGGVPGRASRRQSCLTRDRRLIRMQTVREGNLSISVDHEEPGHHDLATSIVTFFCDYGWHRQGGSTL